MGRKDSKKAPDSESESEEEEVSKKKKKKKKESSSDESDSEEERSKKKHKKERNHRRKNLRREMIPNHPKLKRKRNPLIQRARMIGRRNPERGAGRTVKMRMRVKRRR